AMTERVARLLDGAEAAGIPVAAEFDDFVFDPSVIRHVDGIRGWSPERVREYEDGVNRYRETFLRCRYFIAPTHYLVDLARKAGRVPFLLPNGLNERQLALSGAARDARRRQPDGPGPLKIGYFSGSMTHNA